MLRVVCNLLLALVLVCAVALAAVLGVPVLMGDQLYAVQTGSMAPTYPVGSIVAVRPVVAADIREGDVITFWAQGFETPVTHRVVQIDAQAGTLMTKGDANPNTDFFPVPFENVQGRVRFGIPYLGRLVAAVRTPGGLLVLAWVCLLVVALLYLPGLVARLRGRHGPARYPALHRYEAERQARRAQGGTSAAAPARQVYKKPTHPPVERRAP